MVLCCAVQLSAVDVEFDLGNLSLCSRGVTCIFRLLGVNLLSKLMAIILLVDDCTWVYMLRDLVGVWVAAGGQGYNAVQCSAVTCQYRLYKLSIVAVALCTQCVGQSYIHGALKAGSIPSHA